MFMTKWCNAFFCAYLLHWLLVCTVWSCDESVNQTGTGSIFSLFCSQGFWTRAKNRMNWNIQCTLNAPKKEARSSNTCKYFRFALPNSAQVQRNITLQCTMARLSTENRIETHFCWFMCGASFLWMAWRWFIKTGQQLKLFCVWSLLPVWPEAHLYTFLVG